MSGRRALFCRDLDGNAMEFMEDNTLRWWSVTSSPKMDMNKRAA
jgi:catechol-2,3-dioxygenase